MSVLVKGQLILAFVFSDIICQDTDYPSYSSSVLKEALDNHQLIERIYISDIQKTTMSNTEGIIKADGLNSFRQTDESEMEDDIEAFTNAIEEKLLEEEDKREGDMKRKSTSLDQEEESQRLQAKKVKLVWGSPITRLQDFQNNSDVLTVLEELKRTEIAVCLGFEVDTTTMKCRLCGFIPTVKANLNSHITKVHCINFKLKLCKSGREKYFQPNLGQFEQRYRGCRKIFTEESFDLHTCTSETPNPEIILDQSFNPEEKGGQEDQAKLELTMKAGPIPPQPSALPADDNFRASTTLTLFIEPASFHRSKMFESTKNTDIQSSTEFLRGVLLGLSCHVYPPQEEASLASCHVAIQPPNRLSENPALMNSYTSKITTRMIRSNKKGWGIREKEVKTLFYTNKAGLTLQCQNQSNAFLEVNPAIFFFFFILLRSPPSLAS